MDLVIGLSDKRWIAGIKSILRSIALLLGAIQLFLARNGFGPDSRSYAEIARAYLRHDWAMAVNAYWGPMYSWLIALTLDIGRPSLRHEFPLLHALNFLIFIVAIIGFEFFWSGLLASKTETSTREQLQKQSPRPLPDSALWILGYALFIWLTIGSLITVLGPDLGVATVALFIGGLVVRIKKPSAAVAKNGLYIWLGIALGLGYLTKAVMFPMAFVFLIAAFLLRISWRQAANVGVAFIVFASIAAPQIILLSKAKGKVTFSESGKLTFAWSNYNLPIRNWQGQPPGSSIPLHPTRMVYRHPDMFEFNGPIRATYPPWYDPSYWNAGMAPRFNASTVLRHFTDNAKEVLSYFARPRIWIVGIILLLLCCEPGPTMRGVLQYWYLLVPSICIFGAYSLTFAEFRYMPAWLLMVWAAVLAGARVRPGPAGRGITLAIAISVAVVMLASITYGLYAQSKDVRHDDASVHYSIAEGLTKLGLRAGDKVGAIGFDNDSHWAYLDGLRIVAEIGADQECNFWTDPSAEKKAILQAFAQAGAAAIVANEARSFKSTSHVAPINLAACARADEGWKRIGDTEDYVYFIY